jgi:hypothetical protein
MTRRHDISERPSRKRHPSFHDNKDKPMKDGMIDGNRLREILHYTPDTGVFVWRVGCRAGDVAGCPNSHGYRRILINGRSYKEHRLAWLYTEDEWPNGDIDHINGDKSDNRRCNIRLATRSQNIANVRAISSVKGVSWDKRKCKWQAQIKINGRNVYLGYFGNPQEAAAAYDFAAYVLFEEFARLNVLGSEWASVSLPERTVTKIVEVYLAEVANIHRAD